MKPESKPKIQNPKWPKPTWIAGEFCASDSVLWSRDETVTVVRPGAWKKVARLGTWLRNTIKGRKTATRYGQHFGYLINVRVAALSSLPHIRYVIYTA